MGAEGRAAFEAQAKEAVRLHGAARKKEKQIPSLRFGMTTFRGGRVEKRKAGPSRSFGMTRRGTGSEKKEPAKPFIWLRAGRRYKRKRLPAWVEAGSLF